MDSILASRTQGIGASQVAALWPQPCSPWTTRFEVYCEALGLAKPKTETLAMKIGKLLEDDMAEMYTLITGRKVLDTRSRLFVHPTHQFIVCHPDGLAYESQDNSPQVVMTRGVELKWVGDWRQRMEWGEPDAPDPEVPLAYYLQVQHEMLATGRAEWDLCPLLETLRIYPLKADPEIQKKLVEVCCHAWGEIAWLKNLLAGTPDERDKAARFLHDLEKHDEDAKAHMLRTVYPFVRGDREPCPVEHLGWFEALLEQKQIAAAAGRNLEELCNRFRLEVKEGKGWNSPNSKSYVMRDKRGRVLVKLDKEHEA